MASLTVLAALWRCSPPGAPTLSDTTFSEITPDSSKRFFPLGADISSLWLSLDFRSKRKIDCCRVGLQCVYALADPGGPSPTPRLDVPVYNFGDVHNIWRKSTRKVAECLRQALDPGQYATSAKYRKKCSTPPPTDSWIRHLYLCVCESTYVKRSRLYLWYYTTLLRSQSIELLSLPFHCGLDSNLDLCQNVRNRPTDGTPKI